MALLDFHGRSGDGGVALQCLLDSVEDIDLTKSEFHLAAQVTCASYLRALVASPVPLDPLSWREARIADFVKNPSLDEALVVVLRAVTSSQLMRNYRTDSVGMVPSQPHTSFQEHCDKEVSSLGTCAEVLSSQPSPRPLALACVLLRLALVSVRISLYHISSLGKAPARPISSSNLVTMMSSYLNRRLHGPALLPQRCPKYQTILLLSP
jgi:hypothetical protein